MKKDYKLFNFFIIFSLVLMNILFSSSPISRFFLDSKYTRFSLFNYLPSTRSEIIKHGMINNITLAEGIVISSQNTVNYFPMYEAKYLLPFPLGIINNHKQLVYSNTTNKLITIELKADYVIIDYKRPRYIIDKSCSPTGNECNDGVFINEFETIVEYINTNYNCLYEYDGFYIYKLK